MKFRDFNRYKYLNKIFKGCVGSDLFEQCEFVASTEKTPIFKNYAWLDI
jgi:hypothetical protein